MEGCPLNISDQQTQFSDFIASHAPVLILTGAGVSTDSGIPAYRDTNGNWKHRPPVQHQDFTRSSATRQRYWARSLSGWPLLRQARPNSAHFKIAELESRGLVTLTVTQNVDGLHQKAGSERVIDLHGRADAVVCLSCGYRQSRAEMHDSCLALNPDFAGREASVAPDGDAGLEMDFSTFKVPGCPHCAGVLKTDVVFFGDSVPRERVEQAFDALTGSRGLLVIGSSLTVFSGFRFARHAHRNHMPIAILTLGRTRADELATVKLDAAIAPLLASI